MSLQRVGPILLAIGVGVGTGYYVFQPLLREYEHDTHGTWVLPEDRERVKKLEEKHQHNTQSDASSS
ncbi:hypothetical protein DM01DRAFT_1336231 [Hesseltinella vesiculosa]|uniref:Uncharacterized protein n=1 Tax=Hesseltinella vesiculosa TaxID=101127 RepID=A0A1X2GH30_9FUNG|nr:hypothetical protein DM01DRAFT_1336231 [Hesseltinella vesiculosa]